MASTTTTSLATLLPNIKAEAQFQSEERSIMRNLVRNYPKMDGTGKTVNVPKYPVIGAADLTEGVDMSSTEVTTGEAILTVGEVGVQSVVTDLSVRTAADNVIASVGRQIGGGMATKMDKDLVALFSGFSSALGTGVETIAVENIHNGVALLEEQGLAMADMSVVLHPRVIHDLKASLTNSWNPGSSEQAMVMTAGFAGFIDGIPVFRSANITSTAGQSVGGIFHRDAIGLAVLREIAIEDERDASLRATELNGTSTYAVGEIFDEYGVALNFLSTLG